MNLSQYLNQVKTNFIGRFLFYVIPYRKKVITKNIKRVYGNTITAKERDKLTLAFYSHLAKSVCENIFMRFLTLKQIKRKAVVIGHEKVLKAAEKNKGVLILTAHMGNWELAPIASILNFKEFQHRLHFIRRTLGNKTIERIAFRRYYKAGLEVIPKKNALMTACDVLDKNDAVVFLLDQHADVKNKDGLAVEFFSEKAGTYQSLAMMARYTEAPVIPACSYRREDGKHVLQFFDPIPWIDNEDSKQELYLNTLNYNKALEKMILTHPEQWLWLHRRWKLSQ